MATAEAPLAGLPQAEASQELAKSWRRLTRAATAVAVATSPAFYVGLTQANDWTWWKALLATVARVVPVEQAAAATSGCLFFTYFGVVVGPPLFGLVAGAMGGLGAAFATLALPLAWAVAALWRWQSSAPAAAPP